MKCLLDTDASGSIIAAKHANKLPCKITSGKKIIWTTPGGELTTSKECKTMFILPEFHRNRVVEWNCSIAPNNLGAYDMIFGQDLLQGLGMKFDFTDNTVEWDRVVIPMQDIEVQVEGEEAFYQHEPDAVTEE